MKIFEVKANNVSSDRGIVLGELGRPAKPGEIFTITEDRKDNLVNGKNKFNVIFAELIGELIEPQPEDENEKVDEEPIEEKKPVKKARKTSKKVK